MTLAAQLHFDIFSIVITLRSLQLDFFVGYGTVYSLSRVSLHLARLFRRENSSIGLYTKQCHCAQRTTCSLRPVTLQSYYHILETNDLPTLQVMSHTHPAATSSPNFQLIFNNAVKAYGKRTKNDLLAHPLAAQLQECNSPSAILDVLQQQVQDLNQFRMTDERWTKWLDPTVNVLYALSGTLGEGVGLVCLSS